MRRSLRSAQRAAENAPLTTRRDQGDDPAHDLSTACPTSKTLIAQVYGSADFRRGVADFLAKTKRVPDWTGE